MKKRSNINISDLFYEGTKRHIEEHDEAEKAKLGTFRGGNTMVLLHGKGETEWQPAGKCHRQTLLRHLGIKYEKHDEYSDKQIMFAGGRLSEDIWLEKLKASWPGPILTEEDVPTKWYTERGVPVTGRPDVVLCEPAKVTDLHIRTDDGTHPDCLPTPVLGLELKMCASKWTARDVRFQKTPKWDHIAQAAHYAWQLDVPFKLCYISYVNHGVGTGWEANNFPQEGDDPEMDKILSFRKDGTAKSVLPFMYAYDLEFDENGVVWYRPEDESEPWTKSLISIEGIVDGYNYVGDMRELKFLGPRPIGLKPDGEKAGWKACDYCPLKSTCDEHEGDYDEWIKQVKKREEEL